jgi:hypothetical protein
MDIERAYGPGKDIPVHPEYPTCPVSFTEEERQRQKDEHENLTNKEALCEWYIQQYFQTSNVRLFPDHSVHYFDYENAKKVAARAYKESWLRFQDEPDKLRRLERHWPFREGKFLHNGESCD